MLFHHIAAGGIHSWHAFFRMYGIDGATMTSSAIITDAKLIIITPIPIPTSVSVVVSTHGVASSV